MCLSVIDKSNEHPVVIKKFFVIKGSGLCVSFHSHVAHMFFGWEFSNCTDVYIIF